MLMTNKILLHTHTFRTYEVEDAIKAAAKWGYDGIELLIGREYTLEALAEKKRELAKSLDRFKISVDAVHTSSPAASRNEQERKTSIARLKAAIGSMKDLGISVINTSPGRPASKDATEEDYNLAAEYFSEIGDSLKSEDLILTFETHMGVLSDTANSTMRLIRLIGNPRIKVNWDPGNMYATEGAEKPEDAFQILKDHLGHMHIKNCKKIAGQYVWSFPVEEGDLDFTKIFLMLKSVGYTGHLSVEYSGLGDPYVIVSKDIRYVEDLRSRIWGKL